LEIGGAGEVTDPNGPSSNADLMLSGFQCALAGVDDETSEFGPRNVKVWMPNEYAIPQPNDSWDAVVALNVLEHVRMPGRWVRELARVIRPGGFAALVAPISWPYHAVPVDCFRYYPEEFAHFLKTPDSFLKWLKWTRSIHPLRADRSMGNHLTKPHFIRFQRSVLKLIGWPMPTALDVVGIGRKPKTESN